RLLRESFEARDGWAKQRDDWQRRSDAVRAAQQAMAEQELALEQARQELLDEAGPKAAKRLERLRRRWEGLSTTARRDLDKRRRQLNAEQAELDARFAAT